MPDLADRKARLLVLGALLLLALTAEDLRRSFTLLNPGALVIGFLLAAAVASRAAYRLALREGSRAWCFSTLILSLAAVALCINAIALHARMSWEEAGHEEREWTRLDARAERLQAEFGILLNAASMPIDGARSLAERNPRSAGPRSAQRAYETLDLITAGLPAARDRIGVSLYRADGRALAWSGPVRSLPRELLVLSIPRDGIKWLIVDEEGLSRLVVLARPWRDPGLLIVVETLLRSAYDSRVLASLLSDAAFSPRRDRLSFVSFRLPAIELEDLFAQLGDVRRLPAGDLLGLTVALRAPDGALLGHATLRGRTTGEVLEEITAAHRRMGSLTVVLAGALFVGILLLPHRGSAVPELRRQGVRIAAVWGLRFLILVFPLPGGWTRPALDDAALFARDGLAGLLGSPLDFLLTSAAILVTGILVSLVITRSLPERPAARGTGKALAWLVAALALTFFFGTRLPVEALRIIENSRVELLSVVLTDLDPAKLSLQAATAFSLLGVVVPLVTLIWASFWALASRADGGPPPPPDPTDRTLRWLALLILPCAILVSFVLEIALQPAATRHLRGFLERDLREMVLRIETQRERDLLDAIADVRSFTGLPERIEAVPVKGDPTLAYELWLATPLAGRGYAGSMTVSDLSGAVVSRFSRSYPEILDARILEPTEISENTIYSFPSVLRGRRVPGLHAHTVVRRNDEPVGVVTVHLRDDFGDIPGLSPLTPLEEAVGGTPPLTTLLPSWNPQVGLAVYSPQGAPLLASPRDPPPPPPQEARQRLLEDPMEMHWQERREEGTPWHDLFFALRGQILALSFPEPGLAERLARAIRLSVQNLAALVLLVMPWGVASGLRLGWRPSPARLIEALTRTHYRRLFASFLVAALVPLTLLALALTNFVRSEVAEDVAEHGWTLLGSIRRQVEEFGRVQELGGIPDDAYLFSLAEETTEDLSLFTEGVLRATSDREIYDLGVLPKRLDGEVNRRIEIEGRRVVIDQVRLGGNLHHRIHGVVPLGPPHEGVLSILLAAENPQIERRARHIYDVMLISYASVILFMGLVAYALARRIARPIRNLSQAAARIATGDLRAQVSATARDETGDLIESFNAMARALRRQHDDLEERGNYIEKILLNATTGVLSVDLRGRIVTFNPAAVAILALPGLNAGADLTERLASREDCRPLADALRVCLVSPSRTRQIEAVIGTEETGRRNTRVRIVPFMEGAGLLIFLEDVTETVRSNRLATWAEMARRIAHEIKNPLTPIKLSADHIRRVFKDGSEDFPGVLQECLRTINEQIENLRSIAGQFSSYARHPEIRREPTPIRDFLEEVLRPYRTAPPPGVTIECRLDGVLGKALIDRAVLSQAVVNVMENALQAMPDGGRIDVTAEVSSAPDRERRITLLIADTGVGMDSEALSRAFQPYFSTKGTGTGLGMAIARRAVEEHQGSITLESAPGKGTKAKIELPVS